MCRGRFRPWFAGALSAVLLLLPAASGAASRSAQDYVIGVRDILEINLFSQPDLSGQYAVETDGAFSFPLIGRVVAAGRTVGELEEALRARLLDGYFRNPRVTVAVAEYRSQRVFVVGEVRSPGAYPLAAETSLIEILALAGLTPEAAGAAVVVRSGGRMPVAGGAGTPPADNADTVRVNLRDLEGGDLSRNVVLRDGDTVFVPRAEVVYVFGEVREPGSYPIQEGMTVLQALSLAGGSTEFAALNRLTVMRVVDGEQVEIRVRLDEPVRRDDTIRVPVKFF
ncbi:MAG: SLBB domain-containing protein [Acidobacteria bacterium]|nr:SLBB domain-containing protein [Acidobacteriota bacterium]